MASITAPSNEVLEFLKIWGIDIRGLTSVTIKIELDDVVRITTVHLLQKKPPIWLWGKRFEEEIKHYALVELKNE